MSGESDRVKKKGNFRVCLFSVFENCFLFSKIRRTRKNGEHA